jgi:hypothetical protein
MRRDCNEWNRVLAVTLQGRRHDRLISLGLLTALVEPERWILISNQASHPQGPTVHAEQRFMRSTKSYMDGG